MNICIYGSSLSAWVAATCLAKVGHAVVIDEVMGDSKQAITDVSVIRDEPGLLTEVLCQIKEGRLSRRQQHSKVTADVHWLALQPNEQQLAERVMDDLRLNGARVLVVNQCNFKVGATEGLQLSLGGGGDVVYMPDNLQEGLALQGFMQPSRVILGIDKKAAVDKTKAVLQAFTSDLDCLQLMSSREAEFTKFAITGMLALRIGYINELANLADLLQVDINIVQESMGADPRIGSHYLSPGCGFGGQNFDAYVQKFSGILQKERQQSLLKTVIEENEVQKELLFRKLWQHYQGKLTGKVVALWGASFKPGTGSIDNAPSIKIIDALISQGVQVNVHDPEALGHLINHYGQHPLINYSENHLTAVEGADAVLLVTEWPIYKSPDYKRLVALMRVPLLIDGRNMLDKRQAKKNGFTYLGVGR